MKAFNSYATTMNPTRHNWPIIMAIVVLVLLFTYMQLAVRVAESAATTQLSDDGRLACQTAIEEIYWQNREWPAVNPNPKPALAEVMSTAAIAKKVDETAALSNALEAYWQTEITGEMLQAEMNRQAANTKNPEMLRELWAALDNDPALMAECLARPALARRLVENWQRQDTRYNEQTFSDWWAGAKETVGIEMNQPQYDYQFPLLGESVLQDNTWTDTAAIPLGTIGVSVWTGSEMIFLGDASTQGFRYHPTTDTWETMDTRNTPNSVWDFTAVWSGTEMITWGGCNGSHEFCTTSVGGRYNPATDNWTATSTTNAPTGRRHHGAVWSGTEMIIWGGCTEDSNGNQNCNIGLNSGGRYNPTTNIWQATTLANAPAARNDPELVWAGDQMILWSGTTSTDPGRRYNPVSNTWTNISTTNAPPARLSALVWTGSEMISWGGCTGAPFCDTAYDSGGRYNLDTDTWTPTSMSNAPTGRWAHDAVWTGSEMIVWGGTSGGSTYFNTGSRYNPVTDSWTQVSTSGAPSGRYSMPMHWTGDLMLVWGGFGPSGTTRNGGRYNPASNSWTPISAEDPNSYRYFHTAIWTGSEMIAWGGEGDGTAATGLNTGRRYDPVLDHWTAVSDAHNLAPRDSHTAIWTGTEMIIWGGDVYSWFTRGTGGRYNPMTDSWTPTNDATAPVAKANHTAVWTGSEMIVWGGSMWDFPWTNTGARYNPASDSWTEVTTSGAPQNRYFHSGVWTGSEMIIWGGSGEFGHYGDGARYNPTSNNWTPMSNVNAPVGRTIHATVWSGNEMIVWGGVSNYSPWTNENSGGRYDPTTDSWTATSMTNAPAPRARLVSVWTGDEMIVWSGCTENTFTCSSGDAYGGRYDPLTDSWVPTTLVGAPEARQFPAAVWTGNAMIVWGGNTDDNAITNTGGLYFADTSGNNAPQANNDSYEVTAGETLNIPAPGVLANDLDPEGDPLSAILESDPTNGSLELNADGSFTYTPDLNFSGNDTFTYRASDGDLLSNIAIVGILVTAENSAPTANDDNYSTDEDETLVVGPPGVLSNDSDPDGDAMTVSLLTDPAHGSLVLNADGSFTYNPDPDFNGADSFTYEASDGQATSNPATVFLTIESINDAPTAGDDSYGMTQNTTLTVDAPGILENDTDIEGDSLSAVLVSTTTNGVLDLSSDGSFTYTPDTDFVGIDTFTYQAIDGLADSNTATVTIIINEFPNNAPVAVDDDYSVQRDATLVITAPGLLSNDSDPDGDPLTAELDTGPANGTVTVNTDGSFTYTPDTGFTGIDTFTYLVDDGRGGTDTAQVTITVNENEEAMWQIYLPMMTNE